MRRVPGICDRCGQRYYLRELREEDVMGKMTGVYSCPSCYDKSHPQLETRRRTDDKQFVKNSRSDQAELEASRRLSSWNPVGHEATGVVDVKLGRVTVVIT